MRYSAAKKLTNTIKEKEREHFFRWYSDQNARKLKNKWEYNSL